VGVLPRLTGVVDGAFGVPNALPRIRGEPKRPQDRQNPHSRDRVQVLSKIVNGLRQKFPTTPNSVHLLMQSFQVRCQTSGHQRW